MKVKESVLALLIVTVIAVGINGESPEVGPYGPFPTVNGKYVAIEITKISTNNNLTYIPQIHQ